MASFVSIDTASVVLSTDSPVHSWDITDQVSKVEVSEDATIRNRTTLGNTHMVKGRGLKKGSFKIDFFIDFDEQGMFETFVYLWNNHDTVDFVVEDTETGVSASGTFVMSQMPSFSGSVDEDNKASLTFETTGPIVYSGHESV